MYVADIGANGVQRVHGIGLAVQDQVGGVEVHAQIVTAHRLKAAQERHRRFLPRLKQQPLAVLLQVLRHGTDRVAQGLELRIIGILRDKAHVRNHVDQPQLMGEVRAIAQILHTHSAIFRRHQTQNLLPFIEVPRLGAVPAAPEGGNGHAVCRNKLLDLLRVLVRPILGSPCA